MEIKGGRAELLAGFRLAVRFGPPTIVQSKGGRDGAPRTWVVRGRPLEVNRFLVDHTPAEDFRLNFQLGTDTWVMEDVTGVEFTPDHIKVRCQGEGTTK
jgi:hypothetical protein